MGEENRVDDNGHKQEEVAGGTEKPKVVKLMEIYLAEDGKVFVKGPLGEQKETCLRALGEAVKIVASFEKPVIVKPNFIGGVRNFLRKK